MGTTTDTASRPARLAVTNGRLVLPDRIAEGLALVVEDDRIAAITPAGDVGSDTAIADAGGRLVIPGLVDIHTHGGRGVTFNEPTADAFGRILEMNAEAGVTSVVGTLGGVTIAETVACLDFARGWQRSAAPGSARLIGMHLESPYIEPAQAGALDPAGIRRADDGSAEPLFEHTGILRILMLAPELPGARKAASRAEVHSAPSRETSTWTRAGTLSVKLPLRSRLRTTRPISAGSGNSIWAHSPAAPAATQLQALP